MPLRGLPLRLIAKTVFTANGTWTKDSRTLFVTVDVIGGGGGGGAGAGSGGSDPNVNSGSGGGGGSRVLFHCIPANDLNATEAITVGAQAAGGTAPAGGGTAGNFSAFGSKFVAYGGGGGTVSAGGAGGGGLQAVGQAGQNNGASSGGDPVNATGSVGHYGGGGGTFSLSTAAQGIWGGGAGGTGAGGTTGGGTGANSYYGGGGGGGGADTNGVANRSGGAGGGSGPRSDASVRGNGGAGGGAAAAGTAGASGDDIVCGTGGGGGGSADSAVAPNTATGGAGAAGGVPGGGGGGGGWGTTNGGAGGAGARGEVRVFEWGHDANPEPLFFDDFNGSSIDLTKWIVCERVGDLSNSEVNCVKAANVTVSGSVFTGTCKFETSSCGDTTNAPASKSYTGFNVQQRTPAFLYGTIQVRAKMPGGTGIWPTIWMLGQNWQYNQQDTANVAGANWPNGGWYEIDIAEFWQNHRTAVNTTCHFNTSEGLTEENLSVDATSQYIVYRLQWTAASLIWSVDYEDGTGFHTLRTKSTGVPDQPGYLILSAAIGGTGGGTPDSATFPQSMLVDWVLVTQS